MRAVNYFYFFKTALKQSVQYPVKLVALVTTNAFRIWCLMMVYWYMQSNGLLAQGGVPYDQIVYALLMYIILLTINFRHIFGTLNTEIKSGALETALTRPGNYILVRMCEQLGTAFVPSMLVLTIACCMSLWFTGSLPYFDSALHVVYGAAVLVLSVTVSALLYSLIALPALWINDAEPIYYLVDRGGLVLGGGFLPVALFPMWLQVIAQSTPIGAMYFGTQVFNDGFTETAPFLIMMQVLWIVALSALSFLVYTRAIKSISINGG